MSSLNRTSVGLKLGRMGGRPTQRDLPQSNQRGIETKTTQETLELWKPASIEPAWD